MLFPSLKPILAGNTAIDLVWLALGSAPMAEFAAHARPAAIVLDLQHGLWERGTVEAAIASTGQRVPVIARCADNTRRHRASAGRRRGLGAGAADRNRRRRPARAGRQPLPAARQPLGRRRTAAAAASPPCWKPTRRSRSA